MAPTAVTRPGPDLVRISIETDLGPLADTNRLTVYLIQIPVENHSRRIDDLQKVGARSDLVAVLDLRKLAAAAIDRLPHHHSADRRMQNHLFRVDPSPRFLGHLLLLGDLQRPQFGVL